MPNAWYHCDRATFCRTSANEVVSTLMAACAQQQLHLEPAQEIEWGKSVGLLQSTFQRGVTALRGALSDPGLERVRSVILEYDFRRRGLRLDCVLLADGLVLVLEFKRTIRGGADLSQVDHYAANLLDFHKSTIDAAADGRVWVVPMLIQTQGTLDTPSLCSTWPGVGGRRHAAVTQRPMVCDCHSLARTLAIAIENRRSDFNIACADWVGSAFFPSSSIIDAALSLYGGHDVSAIQQHSAALEVVERVTAEVRDVVGREIASGNKLVVLVSGEPGAGKTLVGLDLVMRAPLGDKSVFVTGNAPLVDVLVASLKRSFQRQLASNFMGFCRSDSAILADNATYKIVKAHHLLRGKAKLGTNGDAQVLVFDEGQRTYRSGTIVQGQRLEADEAALILDEMSKDRPRGQGCAVVVLVGHNQHLTPSEIDASAWIRAASERGWRVAVSEQTMNVLDRPGIPSASDAPAYIDLKYGHLEQSLRYYRNAKAAEWVDRVLANRSTDARQIALEMSQDDRGDRIHLFRDLHKTKAFLRAQCSSGERYGLVGSGYARRLAAEGLFVEIKPSIAHWMLEPDGDFRSSNSLEYIQNQYQVQGLELDGVAVCWDLDLRRDAGDWKCYKWHGADWQLLRDSATVKNGYRVLLTRARRVMAIFVPRGDHSGQDGTRPPSRYDEIAEFLIACGSVDEGC